MSGKLGSVSGLQDTRQTNQLPIGQVLAFARTASESGIIGASAAIWAAWREVEVAAKTHCAVLVTGETGTGKELVARAVHDLSQRSAGPFVAVNCGALPESLIESELFGHKKGAFTGALDAKEGLFEAASGGTIFLDEIGELGLALQPRLLRVLQQGEVRRVGETKARRVDVRVISATSQDPRLLVREGKLREDLCYRLNVLPVFLPPLRQRPEDIPLLVAHFIRKYGDMVQGRITGVPDAALARFQEYAWPGNIRELENFVQYAMAHEPGSLIQVSSLRPELSGASSVHW